MATCMYENEVQIQSSISVGLTATYNRSQTELAISFYPLTARFLSLFSYLAIRNTSRSRRKSKVEAKIRNSSEDKEEKSFMEGRGGRSWRVGESFVE